MESKAIPFQTQISKPSLHFLKGFAKRLFDILFSLSILILTLPLFVVITIAIRLCSKGGAFYLQPRLGRDGKVFLCYKFRTMYCDAHERLQEVLKQNPRLQKEWNHNQKLKCDPRIFPLGRWLRKYSLDELPQFWNVVKGDLSVVGPRPYMMTQQEAIHSFSTKILSVKPGITGLWQTSGRSQTNFHHRILLDAQYVGKQSFIYDIFLILKTVPKVLFSRDAY